MRPRSMQTNPPPGAKKARVVYRENSPMPPGRGKSELSVRQAAETSETNQPQTPASKTAALPTLDRDKIAERAHCIWEREGRPEGRDNEFWFRAEAELKDEQPSTLRF